MDNRAVNEEILETTGPYVGLRPYEESHSDIFFGREQEREILIDKLIANKLTLLFAASGVGKSSLLQAGVLPALKRKKKEPLDVVYYCDWVSDPLDRLKKETVTVLRERKKIAPDYSVYREEEDISLKKFFLLAATFASEPLVVILDQFEEFFQYRRYKENFTRFIEELSECVRDRDRQVVFLVSMREDFALELNIFKKYLPSILFENYFRLEKLTVEKAGEAIVKPLEPLGFEYEGKLLETLLTDLAQREEEARMGTAPAALAKDTPAYVEPPYLQIVCSRLWAVDRDNPGKKIREQSYEQMGGARGFVDSYFNGVMETFSYREKNTAFYAFHYLVTPRGTRMAYTVEDLSDRTVVEKREMEYTLEKLRKARILRSQKREGVIWYELYHDIFSTIIYRWNEKFRNRKLNKRAAYIFAIGIALILVLFVIGDIIANKSGHYLRLSVKETISDRVEVYQGKLKSPDIFNLHRYQAETFIDRNQVEPDKRFVEKQVGDFAELNLDLIGHLPLMERISAYWRAGEIQKALDLVKSSISENDMTRSQQALALLPGLYSKKSYELLKEQLGKSYNNYLRREIVAALAEMPSSWIIDDFIGFLKDNYPEIRKKAVSTLGEIGTEKAVEPLLGLLKDPEFDVQKSAAEALGQIGSDKAVEPLLGLLDDLYSNVRANAAVALGQMGSDKAVEPLIGLLKDPDSDVQKSAAEALGQMGSDKAVKPLLGLLMNPDSDVRSRAAKALEKIGSDKAVKPLIDLLKDPVKDVRASAAEALGKMSGDKAVEPLIGLLKNPSSDVRSRAAEALGNIGNDRAVEPLIGLLKDPEWSVRSRAAEALGNIGSDREVEPLLNLLKDTDWNFRASAAEALRKIGSEKAMRPLLNLLKYPDSEVRRSAAAALGQIGSDKAVEPLIGLLKDPEWSVQSRAAEALGEIGGEKAVGPLLYLLKDPDEDVQRSTAEALGQLGSEKAVRPLLNLLKAPEWSVRSSATKALGQLGSEKAVRPLLNLLKDPIMYVLIQAVEALGQLGSEKTTDDLIDLLKDPKHYMRASATLALGQMGSDQAVQPMLGLLKDPDENVRRYTAEALGKIGSTKAIEPLASLLNDIDPDVRKSTVRSLGKLSADEKIDNIRNRYTKKKEKPGVRLAAAAVLLRWCDTSGLEYLKEISKQDNINRRIELAEALGEAPSPQGNAILLEMLSDENIRVKETVISSLGKARDKSALPHLNRLIQYPNARIRAATVDALSEIAAPESIELLKKVAMNTGERMTTRYQAITGLTKIQHQDALQTLIELLDNENSIIRYKTLIAIGKNPPSPTLPGPLVDRLKSHLNNKLTELEERKARWRAIRDEKTDSYDEEKLKDWNKRLEEVEPNEPMEFELSFALSRIDPYHEGIKLLGHHLANVRQGAWMGLGKCRSIFLIETLYQKRKHSDVPWFIHAAYRAIDHILMNIEAFGGQNELTQLESLYKKLSAQEGDNFHEGVETRMEWTIERLKERV